MKCFNKRYWSTFLAKKIVTRSLKFTLFQIFLITSAFALLGYLILHRNSDLTDANLIKLYLNTAKFGGWFLLGYAGMQAFGYRIEKDRLSEFEDDIYRVHAQVEFSVCTIPETSNNDDKALNLLDGIDNQRIRIKRDGSTSLVLFLLGTSVFFVTSILELFYY